MAFLTACWVGRDYVVSLVDATPVELTEAAVRIEASVRDGRCVMARSHLRRASHAFKAAALSGSMSTSMISPNNRMEVRWKGVFLPYVVFDKDQRVSHAAIVENKRLGAALAFVKFSRGWRFHHLGSRPAARLGATGGLAKSPAVGTSFCQGRVWPPIRPPF